MSKRNNRFVYIGTTMCLRSLLRSHNSGTGSFEVSIEFRSYVLISYICGFKKNQTLIEEIKNTWRMDYKLENIFEWARNAEYFISHDIDLHLVYLLRD